MGAVCEGEETWSYGGRSCPLCSRPILSSPQNLQAPKRGTGHRGAVPPEAGASLPACPLAPGAPRSARAAALGSSPNASMSPEAQGEEPPTGPGRPCPTRRTPGHGSAAVCPPGSPGSGAPAAGPPRPCTQTCGLRPLDPVRGVPFAVGDPFYTWYLGNKGWAPPLSDNIQHALGPWLVWLSGWALGRQGPDCRLDPWEGRAGGSQSVLCSHSFSLFLFLSLSLEINEKYWGKKKSFRPRSPETGILPCWRCRPLGCDEGGARFGARQRGAHQLCAHTHVDGTREFLCSGDRLSKHAMAELTKLTRQHQFQNLLFVAPRDTCSGQGGPGAAGWMPSPPGMVREARQTTRSWSPGSDTVPDIQGISPRPQLRSTSSSPSAPLIAASRGTVRGGEWGA